MDFVEKVDSMMFEFRFDLFFLVVSAHKINKSNLGKKKTEIQQQQRGRLASLRDRLHGGIENAYKSIGPPDADGCRRRAREILQFIEKTKEIANALREFELFLLKRQKEAQTRSDGDGF
jgi:hypothetical protein